MATLRVTLIMPFVLAGLLAVQSPWPASCSVFPNRFATQPCSLIPHPTRPCQFSSSSAVTAVSNTTSTSRLIPVLLGETSCRVTLTGCKPGLCYSFQEVSELQTPMDPVFYRVCTADDCILLGNVTDQPAPVFSVFSSIRPAAGASSAIHSRYGFAFQPASSTVTIDYSTHTCAKYYSARGRKPMQLCKLPVEAMTVTDVGLATGLDCTCDPEDTSCINL